MPLETLNDEVIKGKRAEHAYNEFIRPFLDAKKEQLYKAFLNTDPAQVDHLLEIRRMTIAIEALDIEIKNFIVTGQMAEIQLAGQNDERD